MPIASYSYSSLTLRLDKYQSKYVSYHYAGDSVSDFYECSNRDINNTSLYIRWLTKES